MWTLAPDSARDKFAELVKCQMTKAQRHLPLKILVIFQAKGEKKSCFRICGTLFCDTKSKEEQCNFKTSLFNEIVSSISSLYPQILKTGICMGILNPRFLKEVRTLLEVQYCIVLYHSRLEEWFHMWGKYFYLFIMALLSFHCV